MNTRSTGAGAAPARFVHLIRHAQPLLPDASSRFLGGRSNPPLSPEGVAQAHRLGRTLRPCSFNQIWSSDLLRALQTAQIICTELVGQSLGKNRGPHLDRRLREIDLGLWDGLTRTEVQTRYPEEYAKREKDIPGFRFPEGENFYEAQERAVSAFCDLVWATSGNLLVVAHKTIIRTIICHFTEMPLTNMFALPQGYCHVTILAVAATANGAVTARLVNPTPLDDNTAPTPDKTPFG